MRSLLIPFIVTAAIAACSDQQPPTSPRDALAGVSTGLSASNQSAVPSDPGVKPTDDVGFTKISINYGQYVTVAPGASVAATATCPAGTTPVGGGYRFAGNGPAGAHPFVGVSNLIATVPLQWRVEVANDAPGAATVLVRADILCAS